MGTSQSSNGSPSGVPMVPPWAEPNAPISESGRFGSAKRNLGEFIGNGNKGSMQRGIGQYIKKDMGEVVQPLAVCQAHLLRLKPYSRHY